VLTITSSNPHNGIYGGGYVTYITGSPSGLTLGIGNGILEVENLELRSDSGSLPRLLHINPDGLGVVEVHDIIATAASGKDVNDDAVMLEPSAIAHIYAWNMIVDVAVAGTTGKAALRARNTSLSTIEVENVTVRVYATLPNDAVRADDAGSYYTSLRNVLAFTDGGGGGQAFVYSGTAVSQYNCASDDASAGSYPTSENPQVSLNIDEQIVSDLADDGAAYMQVVRKSAISASAAPPEIADNTVDMRGTPRTGTSIGSIQVLSLVTGVTTVANPFDVEPTMEGPQLLVRWGLPTSPYSLNFKLLKKELNYPDSDTDGEELINAAVSSAPDHYADIGQDALGLAIETVWCYEAFVYVQCSQGWAPDELIERGTIVIPLPPNGYFYESRTRGITDSSQPTWPTQIGEVVQDGDIVWECRSTNPGWITNKVSRDAAFTWDSEYMQRLLFRQVAPNYRNADADSNLVALTTSQDSDNYDVWRALHEDGTQKRGEFERFLLIFGAALARGRGAADCYPRLVDPDESLPQFLPLLAGILGWELNTQAPTARQRQQLFSSVPQYKRKGTTGMLESLLRHAAGVDDAFVDQMSQHILMSNRIIRLSAQGSVVANLYPDWAATTAYSRGGIVIPVGTARTGYYYQTRTPGISGASQPSWPTIPGQDVADGSLLWNTVQFGTPHLTANGLAGTSTLTLDDTSIFEVGKTINVRDAVINPTGEEHIVETIPDSYTLTIEDTLGEIYTVANQSVVSPAYDWYDDETGFIWDIPVIDQFDGIIPDRVRVPGEVLDPSDLYSFEILRLWFFPDSGDALTTEELERVASIMNQFAPSDTSYVIRVEAP
jgi:hypothetical protein